MSAILSEPVATNKNGQYGLRPIRSDIGNLYRWGHAEGWRALPGAEQFQREGAALRRASEPAELYCCHLGRPRVCGGGPGQIVPAVSGRYEPRLTVWCRVNPPINRAPVQALTRAAQNRVVGPYCAGYRVGIDFRWLLGPRHALIERSPIAHNRLPATGNGIGKRYFAAIGQLKLTSRYQPMPRTPPRRHATHHQSPARQTRTPQARHWRPASRSFSRQAG